jgi:hypothetical protein
MKSMLGKRGKVEMLRKRRMDLAAAAGWAAEFVAGSSVSSW